MAQNDNVKATPAGGDPTYFNPTPQFQAPNFDRYSRGAEAPDAQRFSGATGYKHGGVLEGLGNLWKMSVDATDSTIQNEIKVDLTESVNAATDIAIGIPPGLRSKADRMEKITRAHEMGTMPDVHYDALMDLYSREMKLRWGGPNGSEGYSEFIDQTIGRLTGSSTANKLRNSMQRAQEGQSSADKFRTQYEKENEAEIAIAFPGYWDANSAEFKDKVDFNDVRGKVSNIKKQKFQRDEEMAKLKYRQDQGQVITQDADRTARTTFWGSWSGALNRASGPAGQSYGNLEKTLTDALADGMLSTEEDQTLRTALGQFEAAGPDLLNSVLETPDPSTGIRLSDHVSPTFRTQMLTELTARNKFIRDKLLEKDTGALTSFLEVYRNSRLSDEQKFVNSNEVIRLNAAGASVMGTNWSLALGNSSNMNDLTQAITNTNAKEMYSSGGRPLRGYATKMNGQGNFTNEEKGSATKVQLDTAVRDIQNPAVPAQSKSNLINTIYGTDNQGFVTQDVDPRTSKDGSKDTGLGKHETLLKMSSPALLKSAKENSDKTGNPRDWDKARAWVLNESLGLLQQDASTVQRVVTTANRSQVTYNPETHQLDYKDIGFQDLTQTAPTPAELNALNRTNMTIKAMVNVWETEGMTKEQINKNVVDLMNGVGVDANAPKEKSLWQWFQGAATKALEKSESKTGLGETIRDQLESDYQGLKTEGFYERTRKALGSPQRLGAMEDTLPNVEAAAGRTAMNYRPGDRVSSNVEDRRGSWRDWALSQLISMTSEDGDEPTPERLKEIADQIKEIRAQEKGGQPPFPGRMDAGLKDLTGANDNSGWDTVQDIKDRLGTARDSAAARADKLQAERGRIAREIREKAVGAGGLKNSGVIKPINDDIMKLGTSFLDNSTNADVALEQLNNFYSNMLDNAQTKKEKDKLNKEYQKDLQKLRSRYEDK